MFDYVIDGQAMVQGLAIESSSDEFKQNMLIKLHDMLDQRMWQRIEFQMTDDDLRQFDALSEQSDVQAKAWLENRFPNHKAMYDEELAVLIQQLRRTMDMASAAAPNRSAPTDT